MIDAAKSRKGTTKVIATINSTRDLDVYLQNNHPDLGVDQRRAVISAVQAADHPHYGADWGAWLRAHLVFIIAEAHDP